MDLQAEPELLAMCRKPGRFDSIPRRCAGGYWEGGEQIPLPPGAQGGLEPLQDMQVRARIRPDIRNKIKENMKKK